MKSSHIAFILTLVAFLIGQTCVSVGTNINRDDEEIRIKVWEDHIASRLIPNTAANNFSQYKFFFVAIHSEHERAQLARFFKNSNPSLLFDKSRLTYNEYGESSDRLTGGRIMTFNINIISHQGAVAHVRSSARSASLGKESFDYTLTFKNKAWYIDQKDQGPSS